MKKSVSFIAKQTTAVLCTLLVAAFQPVADIGSIPVSGITAEASEKTDTAADATAVSLNATSAKVIIDDSYTLRVYNTQENQTIICKSSDSKIVSVKASGKSSSAFILKGKKCGTAEITIRIREGLTTVDTLKCEVTVGLPAISVSFTRPKLKLSIGRRTSLKTILKPSDTAEEPVYISSDTDIAYVSKKGTVIAKAAGECTITAFIKKKDENGEYICDSCKVIITEKMVTEEETENEKTVEAETETNQDNSKDKEASSQEA